MSKKACAIIDINSSEPLPNIILSLLSEYLFAIALTKSSLTCGGYRCKFVEIDFNALIAFKDVPNAPSFADSLIKLSSLLLPKFGL